MVGFFTYTALEARKERSNDQALLKLVKDSLTPEEYNEITSTQMGSVSLYHQFIEQRVLNEVNKILTGHYASNETYKKAMELNSLAKNFQSE